MTINIGNNNPRVSYTATSGQTVFTIPFDFFEESDITVYINGTEKTVVTHYSVDVDNDGNFLKTITLVDGASSGDKIAIVRDVSLQRTTDFTAGAAISRDALNEQLDIITAQIADIDDRVSRAIQLNDHEVASSITLPAKDDRKGKILGFNETTGDVQSGPTLSDTQSLADISTDIATLADIEDGTDATDAIQTAASISSNITTVSGISSDVSTVAGISSDVTTVASDSTDINTVATNISSVNTVATNINDVIAVANDLNEAVSEVTTVADDLNEAVSEIDTVAGSISNVDTVGTNIADVNTVAGISSDVTTVAGISADTTTVSGISANVTTVAGISSDVTAVAADATDIGTVSTNITNVNSVANNSTNINSVAGNSTNINTVAGDSASIGTVAGISTDVSTVAGNNANVTTVAGISSDVTTVASNDSNITSVATNATNINTTATNISDVNTVAGISSDITAVAGISSDTTTVAGISSDVTTVAGVSSNVTTVAGNTTNINTVSGISANVTTVAGLSSSVSTLALISSDITTVAGISSSVTTVAGDTTNIGTIATNLNGSDTIGTVANSISNVNTVSGSISNVNTVATNISSVNDFADKYRIGATDPTTNNDEGDLFYNTTSDTLKIYTGTAWEQGVTAGSGFLPLGGGTMTGALTLSGAPTANLHAATKAYVDSEISGIVDSAPATLDTLNELAAALGDDANFSTTVTNSIATKLPLAGGTMTGAITFASGQTFDGRDVSADGAKLDGIESGATGDQTASEILTAIKTVDGAGSGLDADTLDGNHASAFLTGNQTITLSGDVSGSGTTSISVTVADDSHNHVISNVDGLQTALDAKLASSSYTAADVLTKIKTVDGSGSGLDSDSVDGRTWSTTRNAANTLVTRDGNGYTQLGWINTTSGSTTSTINKIYASYDDYVRYITPATLISQLNLSTTSHNHTYDVNNAWLRDNGDNANVKLYGNSRQMAFRTDGTSEYSSGVGGYPFAWMYNGDASGNRIMLLNTSGDLWTSTNGWLSTALSGKLSTSGKAADSNLLDGIDSSSFLRSDATDTFTTLSGTTLTASTLKAGDGNDGYFYSDSNGRTAFTGGDFYIQSGVSNCYLYATNTYLGATTGDNIYVRGNTISGDSWSITGAGAASFASVNINGNLNAVDNIYLAGTLYHEGDTNTYLSFGTDTITLATGGSSEITVNTTGVRLGDTGNGYFRPVSGNYGSIEIVGGAHTSWEGYSIGGRAVFMHDNSSGTGIYNDVNNQWILRGTHNGLTSLYYAGANKLDTTSTGVTVNGDLNSTSDIRYKKNIETIDSALEKVQSLRGVTFDWDHEDFNSDSRATGVIAQDVEKVLPEAVRENEDGFKNVAYGNMVGLLIEAIKEQQEQIDELKKQLNG